MQSMQTDLILVGKTEEHLEVADDEGRRIHRDALSAYAALKADAVGAGFDLRLCSAFRGFDAQLTIWNAKATGVRAIQDRHGITIDVNESSVEEIFEGILRWSALPGMSRHHWGTDIDVYDGLALPEGTPLRLDPCEFEGQGRFAPLHDWLDTKLPEYGFYRPYDVDRGGVSPERWHLSFAPVSDPLFQIHSLGRIQAALDGADMRLKDEVVDRLPRIFERYFMGISRP